MNNEKEIKDKLLKLFEDVDRQSDEQEMYIQELRQKLSLAEKVCYEANGYLKSEGNEIIALIDEAIARQSVKSEEVAEAIDQVEGTCRKAQKELDSLIETKSRYDHQIEIGDPWNWRWEESWHPLAVEGHKQTIKNANLAITALQAYEPWVSVSERLPDGDVASVLIHTNKGGVSEGQYYPSIKSWKQFRGTAENADVTHWKPQTDEVIILRIEPTEPCEWCDVNDGAWCATYDGRMIALDNEGSPETLLAENWSFCPNCGRRLTDD